MTVAWWRAVTLPLVLLGAVIVSTGAAAGRGLTPQAAPGEPPVSAHPSAPTRALVVSSFRMRAEACP
jgi:hypothetical protein